MKCRVLSNQPQIYYNIKSAILYEEKQEILELLNFSILHENYSNL